MVAYVLGVRCVVTYVLCVRCVVYAQGRGDTYMTPHSRRSSSGAAAAEIDDKQEDRNEVGKFRIIEI